MPKRTCVVYGGTSECLARRISDGLGASLIEAEIQVFADGESKLRLKREITGDRAIVVQSLHPPVDTNLLRALSLISKAREEAADVVAVIPYMGYARQDMEFLAGEVITMKVVGRLFEEAGAARVVVVDIHSSRGLQFFGGRTTNVTAVPALARYFATMRLKDPLVVSPDAGGSKRADLFASELGVESITLDKSRDRRTGSVRIRTKSAAAARDRDIIIIDDMIATGGSIVKAAQFLKGQRCGRIFVACTHALLVGGARGKMREAGVTRVVSANTIPGRSGVVDVSEAIVRALA